MKTFPGKWLVAVSGQNDSMALVDMCIRKGMDIRLCVVHYHLREAADAEVKYIVEYAKANGLDVDVAHAPTFASNFQKEARDFRYQTFSELVRKHQLEGVLVGHHLDDVLETILWQLNRNHRVVQYGLQEKTELYGIKVVRPLLRYTKEELIAYNKRHHVHYFEDVSNEDESYTRNSLRKQLQTMSADEKQQLLEVARIKNKELIKQRERLTKYVGETLSIGDIQLLNKEDQLELFWMYMTQHNYPYALSKKHIHEILQQLNHNTIGQIPLKDDYYLSFADNTIRLIQQKSCNYRWTFTKISPLTTKYFTIKLESDTLDGVYVNDDDFPITIRNFKPGDKIRLSFGHQKLTTWFNQEKIPWDQRQCWPVVVNKNQEIIYVVGWRCDMYHSTNNPNIFVLK